jgi:hypothetical protein
MIGDVVTTFRSWPRRRWVTASVGLPVALLAFLAVAAPASAPGPWRALAPAAPLWTALVALAALAGSLTLASYVPVQGWRPELGCSPCAAVSGLTLLGALVVLDICGPDLSGPLLALVLTTSGLVQRMRQEPACARA